MDYQNTFKHQLTWLQLLVWFKRSFRLVLRAAWLGGAGYLLAWGLNNLVGWFPEEKTWLWVGVAFAALPLAAIFFAWPLRKRLVWIIDRRFELREQISTAWSISHNGMDSSLHTALLSDALALFPALCKQLLIRGWHVSRDLVSLLCVLVLGLGVYVDRFVPITVPELDQVEVSLLVPLGQEARADEIFPNGLHGIESQSKKEPGEEQAGLEDRESDQAYNTLQQAQEALSEMGEKLSQMASTYELGQALQSEDFEQAANAMENLADQVEELESSTQATLAEVIEETAEALSNLDEEAIQELSQNLQDAAEELKTAEFNDEQYSPTKDAFDQVADSLRDLPGLEAALAAAGSGAGGTSGESGQAEPQDRLQGGSEEFELSTSDEIASILTDATPETVGDETNSDILSFLVSGGADIIQTPLVPSYYPWIWRNVVSTYFLSH